MTARFEGRHDRATRFDVIVPDRRQGAFLWHRQVISIKVPGRVIIPRRPIDRLVLDVTLALLCELRRRSCGSD